MSPLVLALHRFVWPGIVLLPVVAANGSEQSRRPRLAPRHHHHCFGGLPLALWSYFGYLFVPLGHGTIIQPSCAALGGLVLARLVLNEPLPPRRIAGALTIVLGLCVIGAEALGTMGRSGFPAICCSSPPELSFAIFGMLLRLWRIVPCGRWRSRAYCR